MENLRSRSAPSSLPHIRMTSLLASTGHTHETNQRFLMCSYQFKQIVKAKNAINSPASFTTTRRRI